MTTSAEIRQHLVEALRLDPVATRKDVTFWRRFMPP